MFHEWNAIYIDLFKEFQTTLKVFEKKKLQKYKNHISKAYLVTPVGSMKNSFKKTC